MDKNKPTTAVSSVDSSNVDETHDTTNWQPGYRRGFAWEGFGALVGVFLCACAAVGVLVASDGQSATQWPKNFAPNVALSAINAVANLLLAMAVAEGVAISWWRKALHGATVGELHRSWQYSTETMSILRNWLRLDKIALAALATKLTIADSILLQRSTTPYVAPDPPRNISLTGIASTTFPTTGFVVSEGNFGAQTTCDCYMIGDSYTEVVNTWETSNGFFKGYEQLFNPCNGICYTRIEAIGFEITCDKQVSKTDLAAAPIAAYRRLNGASANSSLWSDVPIFNSSFNVQYPDEVADHVRLGMKLDYFQSSDPFNPSSEVCTGAVTSIQCSFRPAIVRYPVKIMNYHSLHVVNGVSLEEIKNAKGNYSAVDGSSQLMSYDYARKQAEGIDVVRYVDLNETTTLNSTTALGGIANAFHQFLASTASITYTSRDIWALRQVGTLAQTMMYGPPNMGSCDCSFRDDSLSVIVASVNQLMFLSATGMVDRTSFTNMNAGTQAVVRGITNDTSTTSSFITLSDTVQVTDVTHYRTNYLYMSIGVAIMLICIAFVLPSFWGYGQLGRKVTMGPMEIAHAFGAPVLSKTKDGRALDGQTLDKLIDEVGARPVRYGYVEEVNGSPTTPHAPTAAAPSPTIAVASGNANSLTTPTSPTVNRRSVVLRVDDQGLVTPAQGVSGVASPRSPNPASPGEKRSSKLWS